MKVAIAANLDVMRGQPPQDEADAALTKEIFMYVLANYHRFDTDWIDDLPERSHFSVRVSTVSTSIRLLVSGHLVLAMPLPLCHAMLIYNTRHKHRHRHTS